MKEIFKPIPGYPDYEISNFGRAKSLKFDREKILKPSPDNDGGYLSLTLCSEGERKTYRIAHLVYDAFGKGKRNGRILQIDHLDANKQNNRIDNLQLLSHRENTSKGHMFKKTSSKFTGVCWCKHVKKWLAKISKNGKRKHLGYYSEEKEASKAYQKALKNHLKIGGV